MEKSDEEERSRSPSRLSRGWTSRRTRHLGTCGSRDVVEVFRSLLPWILAGRGRLEPTRGAPWSSFFHFPQNSSQELERYLRIVSGSTQPESELRRRTRRRSCGHHHSPNSTRNGHLIQFTPPRSAVRGGGRGPAAAAAALLLFWSAV